MGKRETTTIPQSPRAESVAPISSDARTSGEAASYEGYVVEGEQGRGGLGRVLRAHDTRLGRPVAIKELLVQDHDAEARFLREACLTARLQHPSIVPIYELGVRADGSPYYAMKLIAGDPLEALIAKTTALDERLALLPNVIAVAEAIAYAHDQGIIHRDLKPSNVVVGAFGETMVIDWGLAKDLRDPAHANEASRAPIQSGDGPVAPETLEGQMMGTLAYMSPEQFEGKRVDERSDVFALGACLYHTITGAAPYAGTSMKQIVAQVTKAEPTPIEAREPGVPPELAAIVKKAMRADPEARYATAKELAIDLKRFQTGQLVSAHHYSAGVLLQRWLARHKRGVATALAFVIALGAVGAYSFRRIVREKSRAEAQGAIAREERARAEERALLLTIVEARTSLDRDPTAAVAWLKTYPKAGPARREAATIAADAQRRGVARHVLRGHKGAVAALAVSPDGKTLATGDGQTIRLWDLASGASRGVLTPGGSPQSVDFTADGRSIVAPASDGAIYVIDTASGAMRAMRGHTSKVRLVSLAKDGSVLVSASDDRTVRVFTIATGESRVVGTHAAVVEDVAISPDGRDVAAIGADGLRIWSLRGGAPRDLPASPGEMAARVNWSPDGKHVAAMERAGGTIRLFDTATWRSVVLRGHEGALQAMVFSPDGSRLASCGRDGTARVWSVADGSSRVLRGHVDVVEDVTWWPDGSRVVTSGEDGTVRVWDIETGDATVLRGHDPIVQGLAISPDGRWIASGGADHSVRVWDGRGDPHQALRAHDHDVHAIAFSPDGRTIASGAQDDRIVLWTPADGRSDALTGHSDAVAEIAFAPNGRLLVSGSWDHTVRVWDLGAKTSRTFAHDNAVTGIAVARDSSAVASSSTDGTAHVIELPSGEVRVLRGHTGSVRAVAFSPDGALVATAGADKTVRLWDRATGAPRATLTGHEENVSNVLFSPDGKLLASASWDLTVRLWDASRFAEVAVLRGHVERVRSLAFSPDGTILASGSNDRTVRIWDVPARALLAVAPHDQLIRDLAFSPDGSMVASASNDRTLRLWDARTGAIRALHRAQAPITTLAWAPDGARVASAGWDRTLRVWPIEGLVPIDPDAVRAWLDDLTTVTVDAASGEVATR